MGNSPKFISLRGVVKGTWACALAGLTSSISKGSAENERKSVFDGRAFLRLFAAVLKEILLKNVGLA
jgi:hypothetical protein